MALLPQNGLVASTACTFSTPCLFAYVCIRRRAVALRVRSAPSFDQYGLFVDGVHIYTKATLRLIIFGCFFKPARLCSGRPILSRLGCLLEAPGPPRKARPPKGTPEALQGGSLERLGLSLGCLWAPFSKPSGPDRHPEVVPRTGVYEAMTQN